MERLEVLSIQYKIAKLIDSKEEGSFSRLLLERINDLLSAYIFNVEKPEVLASRIDPVYK